MNDKGTRIPIIEAHHHLLEPTKLPRKTPLGDQWRAAKTHEEKNLVVSQHSKQDITCWGTNLDNMYQDYIMEDAKADFVPNGVVKSVFVEGGFPGDKVAETKWAQSIADNDKDGFPHAIIAHCDLTDPNLEDTLKKHLQFKNVRGVRDSTAIDETGQSVNATNEEKFTNKKWLSGLPLLQRYDLPIDYWIYWGQLLKLAQVAKDHPNIVMVLNHMGCPVFSSEKEVNMSVDSKVLKEWINGVKAVAACPNTYVKIGGFGCPLTGLKFYQRRDEVKAPEIAEKIGPFVHECLKLWGTNRAIFESNFPVDKVSYTYTQFVNGYKLILDKYEHQQQKQVFYNVASSVYRI